MSVILRPYQDELVQKIFREFDSGERNVLTVLPTGGGKTVVFCAVTRDHNVGGTLIISHRREIVAQTCAKLDAIGMHYGVIQAGDDKKLRPLANVQVASVQTLHARAIRGESMALPRADLIIIDEAHHAPATIPTRKCWRSIPTPRCSASRRLRAGEMAAVSAPSSLASWRDHRSLT